MSQIQNLECHTQFGVLFYLLLVLLVSGRYCLDVSLFEKIQDYKEEDF
jgi:hypothetical protein